MTCILIIEDNSDHRSIFRRILERHGYITIDAADAASGLAAARRQSPDLIVLDIRLPDMDGWAVASALRSDPRTRHVPLLLMTATPIDREVIAAQASDYDAILFKPFDISAFLESVTRLLANQRSVGERCIQRSD